MTVACRIYHLPRMFTVKSHGGMNWKFVINHGSYTTPSHLLMRPGTKFSAPVELLGHEYLPAEIGFDTVESGREISTRTIHFAFNAVEKEMFVVCRGDLKKHVRSGCGIQFVFFLEGRSQGTWQFFKESISFCSILLTRFLGGAISRKMSVLNIRT